MLLINKRLIYREIDMVLWNFNDSL